MRLTRFSDYSLRVLIYLALRGEQLSTIQDIADAYAISKNHLMKIVPFLTRLGYVETVRGQNGGIRLGQPPEAINLGRVIRTAEEGAILTECYGPDNRCVITPTCRLKMILSDAVQSFMEVLDEHHLNELIDGEEQTRALLQLDGTTGR